jgi:hypothetical protein
MVLNFLLGTSISFAMSYLWGVVNCLQMIVYLPLFNLTFPANINIIIKLLVRAATFDLPFIDDFIDIVFKPIHTDDEIDKLGFQQLGFETKNFIKNSGSLFIFAAFFFIIRIALAIIKRIAYYNPNWISLYHYTKPGSTATAWFLRLCMQGYVELLIAAMLNMELTSKIDLIFTNFSDAFCYLCGLFFFLALTILPIVTGRAINQKIDMLEF